MATPATDTLKGGRAKSTKPIHAVRLQNLRSLIDKRFNGNAADMARTLSRPHTFMWQLLHHYRAIGEDTARLIEKQLKLAPGAMDLKAALQRSDVLIAHDGTGESQWYRMVPVKSLDNLRARPKVWLPFPAHNASARSFAFTVPADSIHRINRGDCAFADPGRAQLVDEGVYVVMVPAKWGKDVAGLLVAKREGVGRRWRFQTKRGLKKNSTGPEDIYDEKEVKVLARVMSIVRHLSGVEWESS